MEVEKKKIQHRCGLGVRKNCKRVHNSHLKLICRKHNRCLRHKSMNKRLQCIRFVRIQKFCYRLHGDQFRKRMTCYRKLVAKLHGKKVAAAQLVVKAARTKYHVTYVTYYKAVKVRKE